MGLDQIFGMAIALGRFVFQNILEENYPKHSK
jgi:hypothetical protein